MYTSVLYLAAAIVAINAAPQPNYSRLFKRQVPQEHSHDKTITNDFRDKCFVERGTLPDPIFGLLGDKAANEKHNGDGKCLQQDIADFVITNAKAKMTGEEQTNCIALAIMYRSLERNTNTVGQKSTICDRAPKNPELATITQHQDPAAEGQPKINQDVELAVAAALAKIGVKDFVDKAKLTATFPPGKQATDRGPKNSQGIKEVI